MAEPELTPGLSGPQSVLYPLPIPPPGNATGDVGSPLGKGRYVKPKVPVDSGPFLSRQLCALPPASQSPLYLPHLQLGV